jgi:hypothetical protein
MFFVSNISQTDTGTNLPSDIESYIAPDGKAYFASDE